MAHFQHRPPQREDGPPASVNASSNFEWDDAPAAVQDSPAPHPLPWLVAIIDDDEQVHEATSFALYGRTVLQRPITLLHAHSSHEGVRLLSGRDDIAVAVVDVVMETPDAGLELIKVVSSGQKRSTQLIVRTGQPGHAPEQAVVESYAISDYLPKAGLTSGRLISALTTSIRAYQHLRHLDEQHAKLARANARLDELAHEAAHELREPLRTIHSYAARLDELYTDHLDNRGKHYLNFVLTGARRMGRLLDDIIEDATVPKRGDRLAAADADRALASALEQLEMAIQASAAQVSFSALPRVQISELALTRVFRNVIQNAIQYRSLASPRIEVSWKRTHRWATIAFADNGIGIPASQHTHIFQRFRRLHGQDAIPGSGLGLALCQDLVRAVGGQMWVRSVPGEGATFFVRLELAPT